VSTLRLEDLEWVPRRFPHPQAKVPNVADKTDPSVRREVCPWCGNLGWLELRGSFDEGGVEYERGMAPCRGCKLGDVIYNANMAKGVYFERYSEIDVNADAIPIPPGREVAGRAPRAYLAMARDPEPAITQAPFEGDEPPPPPGPDDFPF
jgi:hypothetical protein